jgi:hypothetical protein
MTWSSTNATGLRSDFRVNGRPVTTPNPAPIPLSGSARASQDEIGTYVITLTPTGSGGTGRTCSATIRVSR